MSVEKRGGEATLWSMFYWIQVPVWDLLPLVACCFGFSSFKSVKSGYGLPGGFCFEDLLSPF